MDSSDEDKTIVGGDANAINSTGDRAGSACDNDAGVAGAYGDDNGRERDGLLDRGVVRDVDDGEDCGDVVDGAGADEDGKGEELHASATSAA